MGREKRENCWIPNTDTTANKLAAAIKSGMRGYDPKCFA